MLRGHRLDVKKIWVHGLVRHEHILNVSFRAAEYHNSHKGREVRKTL
jgi:hypothetical protein